MAPLGDEALVGRILDGRYLIGQRIARGGMASVYMATDRRLDRTVAVKVMHQDLGDEADFLERFNREAQAAAKLNHRGVVSVFDQGTDRDVTYLVMEYVPGQTLRDLMRAEAPMSPDRSLGLLADVLVALSAAHAAGIIHRDIKPENVLITPDGDVKVADFGLARAVSTATTAPGGALIGTVSYLAPEIVMNERADARSDVYACGAMLYEMLTGSKPHGGDTPIQVAYKHVHEDVGKPSDVQLGLPDYVDALVARATARDRNQRPADARVLLQMVRRVQRALDQGLTNDPALATQLLPKENGEVDELTEAVDLPMFPVELDDSLDVDDNTPPPAPSEPTVQWTTGAPPPAPRGVVPAMSPEKYREDRDSTETKTHGSKILVGAIIAAIIVGGLGWYFGIGRYDDAPRLVGMSESSAVDEAESDGFVLKVTARDYSETAPLGTVMSTDPEAGDRILPGHTIEAIVSKGPERHKVPDIKDLPASEAVRALRAAHLEVGKVTEEYSETIAQGHVKKLADVEVGDELKRDTPVSFVVSKGREPIAVPSFVGRSRSTAVGGLQSRGFRVAVRFAYSDSVSEGDVMGQYPRSGTRYRGDTISITVSRGPDIVRVPNVKGDTVKSAKKRLQNLGFSVSANGNSDDIVSSQSPSAGSDAKHGDTVKLGSHPPPVDNPTP